MMTGIGGQGIQLAAQALARSAVDEGREVLLFGSYGGMMRGGNTEATIVVADGPIESPPTVASTWSAVVMHHEHWEPLRRHLRPGSLVLVNSTVFEATVDWSPYTLIEVQATDLAVDVGSVQAATMVMIGAYVAVTGLVGLASLCQAMEDSLPPYRAHHATRNAAAIEAGFAAVPPGIVPAWEVDMSGVR